MKRDNWTARWAVIVSALALALVGAFIPATPAAAQSAPGTLFLTNALSTTDYSAWVDGSQEVDLERSRAERVLELPAGSHTVELHPAGGSPSTTSPIATRTVNISSGGYATFAVHPTATGTVATSVFDVPESKTGSDDGRLIVRHLAEAGPVDVELAVSSSSSVPDGTTDSFTLSNGQQGVVDPVKAQENLIYELRISQNGNPLITDTSLTLQAGQNLIVNIGGNPPTAETADQPQSLLERIVQVGALPPPDVWLVNGFTTGQYDFYIGDELSRGGIEPLRRSGQLQATPSTGPEPLGGGTYQINVYEKEVTPSSGSPVATRQIRVCDGQSYDLAVHPNAAGNPILTLFENDIRSIASNKSRMTVRHVGQQGPADFHIMPSGENQGVGGLDTVVALDNGEERTFDDVTVNDYAMEVYNPGTTTGMITQNGDVEQEGGTLFVTYMMGSPPENNPNGRFMPGYEYEPPTTYTPKAPGSCGSGGSGGGTGGGGGDGGGSGGSSSNSVTTLTPGRLVETREGLSTVDGTHQGGGQLPAGSVNEYQIAGRNGIPANADAAILNLAVTNPQARGYLTAYDCGDRPTAATLNYAAGETISNTAVVPLSDSGTVCIYTRSATDLVVDQYGFVPTGSSVDTIKPARLVDTRPGEQTVDGTHAGGGVVAGGTVREFQIAGRAGIPAEADAVLLNIAATGSAARGYLTVYPCGARPTAATLNFGAGETISNSTIARLSDSGTICVFARSTTHVVVDASGWAPTDSPIDTFAPERMVETREGLGTIDGTHAGDGLRPAGSVAEYQIAGRGSVPGDATGAIVNVAVTNPQARGYVTAWDCGERPTAATLNYGAGETISNSTIVPLSADGTLCVYTRSATDLVIDVNGALS